MRHLYRLSVVFDIEMQDKSENSDEWAALQDIRQYA